MLVLTDMNYWHKDTLYEEAKWSLKKFKGGRCGSYGQASIKLVPAFLVENEEDLFAAGCFKSKWGSQFNHNGKRGGGIWWGGYNWADCHGNQRGGVTKGKSNKRT